ncbi:hypothetical protein M5689_012964 [Euphorbia peplus]|nr:hypothetical protein M5689_012964 [Euphorbia peplus]
MGNCCFSVQKIHNISSSIHENESVVSGNHPQDYRLKIPQLSVNSVCDSGNNTTRIKVIMTKKELQELLSNKSFKIEEMLALGIKQHGDDDDDEDLLGNNNNNEEEVSISCVRWQPVLQTIPEGCEFLNDI